LKARFIGSSTRETASGYPAHTEPRHDIFQGVNVEGPDRISETHGVGSERKENAAGAIGRIVDGRAQSRVRDRRPHRELRVKLPVVAVVLLKFEVVDCSQLGKKAFVSIGAEQDEVREAASGKIELRTRRQKHDDRADADRDAQWTLQRRSGPWQFDRRGHRRHRRDFWGGTEIP
jgi:hypothetical protein